MKTIDSTGRFSVRYDAVFKSSLSARYRTLACLSLVSALLFSGCDFLTPQITEERIPPVARENPKTPDYLKPENEVPAVDDAQADGTTSISDVSSSTSQNNSEPASQNSSAASNSGQETTPDEKSLDDPFASSTTKSVPLETNSNSILKYKFEPGRFESYPYEVTPETSGAESIIGSSTFVAYPLKGPKLERPTIEASGTALVVSPDGYLLTCAHVVAEARRIDVRLNDRSYTGNVLAQDTELDLALIKIDAKDLTPLALATGDGVAQGQEVRSVGFPLSTVLGESMKINRGSVAGFVTLNERSLIQIDVPINPGNSGGPVVDLSGNVIGIASEKLAGVEISSVGFCVPARVVREWLKPHLEIAPSSSSSQELSGIDLSKKVTPSVALVKVTAGGHDPNAKLFEVSSSGHYVVSGSLDLSMEMTRSGKLIIDDSGEVLQAENSRQLPFLLGNTSSLQTPELSRTGASKWKSTKNFQLSLTKEEAPSHPLDALMIRRRPFGLGRSTERVVTVVPGIIIDQFQITDSDEKTVTIERTWEIATTAQPDTELQLSCKGKGKWTFDRELGMMQNFEGGGTFVTKTGTKEESVPFSITMKRNTDELAKYMEEEKKKKEAMDSTADASNSTSDASNEKQSSTSQKTTVIKELVSKLSKDAPTEEALATLQELAKMEADSDQSLLVLNALLTMLKHNEVAVKAQAIETLGKWDQAAHVPRVIPLLQDGDEKVLTAAIKYLGNSWDVRATKDLGKVVKEKIAFRELALDALIEIGPAAEAVLLDLLNDSDVEISKAACRAIGKVGGPDSILQLKKLIASSHAASEEAKSALKEIGVEN